jgi:hypothetical protein
LFGSLGISILANKVDFIIYWDFPKIKSLWLSILFGIIILISGIQGLLEISKRRKNEKFNFRWNFSFFANGIGSIWNNIFKYKRKKEKKKILLNLANQPKTIKYC